MGIFESHLSISASQFLSSSALLLSSSSHPRSRSSRKCFDFLLFIFHERVQSRQMMQPAFLTSTLLIFTTDLGPTFGLKQAISSRSPELWYTEVDLALWTHPCTRNTMSALGYRLPNLHTRSQIERPTWIIRSSQRLPPTGLPQSPSLFLHWETLISL